VNTTGNKNLDSIYTSELCIDAMNFSKEILHNDGKFISKIFGKKVLRVKKSLKK